MVEKTSRPWLMVDVYRYRLHSGRPSDILYQFRAETTFVPLYRRKWSYFEELDDNKTRVTLSRYIGNIFHGFLGFHGFHGFLR